MDTQLQDVPSVSPVQPNNSVPMSGEVNNPTATALVVDSSPDLESNLEIPNTKEKIKELQAILDADDGTYTWVTQQGSIAIAFMWLLSDVAPVKCKIELSNESSDCYVTAKYSLGGVLCILFLFLFLVHFLIRLIFL